MKRILSVFLGLMIMGSLFITNIYAREDSIYGDTVGGEILPILGTSLFFNPVTLLILAIILTGIVILVSSRYRIETIIK